MKNLILSIFAVVALGCSANSTNQDVKSDDNEKKVIVLVNTADWCPACMANGPRVEKNVVSKYMQNEKCQIVVNNMTDDKTKATSKESCDKAEITSVASKNTGTGMIYFIDSETKEIISQISVTKTDEEIIKAFDDAIAKI